MLRRVFAASGIDYDQWRALTRIMLSIDFRASSGLEMGGWGSDAGQRPAFTMMLFFYVIVGLFLALAVLGLDAFVAATLIFSAIMFMAGSMVLIEYQSVVVSPDDYAILAYQPISSRTYFAIKLTNVMIYVGILCSALGLPSVVAFGARLGPAAGLAAAISLYGVAAWVALAMIVAYAVVLRFVHPKRLRRALSYLQMVMSVGIYGGYIIVPRLIDLDFLAGDGTEKGWGLLLYPPAWFASVVDLARGNTGVTEIASALTAIIAIAGLFWYANGKLSLSYAERLSLLESTSEAVPADASSAKRSGSSASGGAKRRSRAAGLLRHEARAVALLTRAQFRYDMKFRMAVMAFLPFTGLYVYLSLDSGSLPDPFVDASARAWLGAGGERFLYLATLHMIVIAMPMTLLESLASSDSFRAAWVFFATPTDKARLILAAKNLVLVCFLLPYLACIFALFAYSIGDWVHAGTHVAVIGMFSSLAVQAAVLAQPRLPFAKPVQKNQMGSLVMVIFFATAVFAIGILPMVLLFAYADPARTIALVAILVTANLLGERLVARRARSQTGKLEFTT